MKKQFEFVALLEKEGIENAAFVANNLMICARNLHKLAVMQCNEGPLNDEQKRKETKYLTKAWLVCNANGLKAVINDDPRGAVLKIQVPSGRTNDFGGEGICVPQY